MRMGDVFEVCSCARDEDWENPENLEYDRWTVILEKIVSSFCLFFSFLLFLYDERAIKKIEDRASEISRKGKMRDNEIEISPSIIWIFYLLDVNSSTHIFFYFFFLLNTLHPYSSSSSSSIQSTCRFPKILFISSSNVKSAPFFSIALYHYGKPINYLRSSIFVPEINENPRSIENPKRKDASPFSFDFQQNTFPSSSP